MRISRSRLCVFVFGCAALGAACAGTEPPPANTGGAPADTGGTSTGTGGATDSGGATATGGQSSSGGAVSGGAASGGAAVTSGGQSAAGGNASGGSASGGAPSGGKATGGAAVGGAASGGQSASGGSGGAVAGCGLSGAATGVQNLQITVGGQVRTYVLSVPTSYSSATTYPLVFGFHGLGGSGALARQYFRVEQAAGSAAIFVYPDGLANDAGQATWSFTTTSADMAFFDALLVDLKTKYCINTNRIFVTGHSMGGVATNALGCYRGDVIRAIAPVAGMPPSAYGGTVNCAGNVGAFIVHGDNDTTVDFTRGGIATRDFWIARNGCSTNTVPDPTTPNACVDYQSCQPDLPVIWCVHNLGHNWPSTTSCDGGICFNAGPAIWGFFASFQ